MLISSVDMLSHCLANITEVHVARIDGSPSAGDACYFVEYKTV